jgi:hypothetical protein
VPAWSLCVPPLPRCVLVRSTTPPLPAREYMRVCMHVASVVRRHGHAATLLVSWLYAAA